MLTSWFKPSFLHPQINYCSITGIESRILNLKHIHCRVVLDLRDNKIAKLPDNIPETLELLYLASNELEEISLPFAFAVGNSSRLRYLDLSYNRLSSVPSMIFNCKTLIYFDVGIYLSSYVCV